MNKPNEHFDQSIRVSKTPQPTIKKQVITQPTGKDNPSAPKDAMAMMWTD